MPESEISTAYSVSKLSFRHGGLVPWNMPMTSLSIPPASEGENSLRSEPRFPIHRPVVLITSDRMAYASNVSDFSSRGVGLLLTREPHIITGDRVTIRYLQHNIAGCVRHKVQAQDGGWQIGIQIEAENPLEFFSDERRLEVASSKSAD